MRKCFGKWRDNEVIDALHPCINTNGLFGFYPCEPIILDGRQTIDMAIELGESVDFDDASITNYAVVRLRGYLVTNAKD